jgi:hypothetical protein
MVGWGTGLGVREHDCVVWRCLIMRERARLKVTAHSRLTVVGRETVPCVRDRGLYFRVRRCACRTMRVPARLPRLLRRFRSLTSRHAFCAPLSDY